MSDIGAILNTQGLNFLKSASELGTDTIVKARFLHWHSGVSPSNLSSFFLFARKRNVVLYSILHQILISSGRVFVTNTRAQRKLQHTWIILIIVKQQLVQIGRMERPIEHASYILTGIRSTGGVRVPGAHVLCLSDVFNFLDPESN